MSRKVKVTYGVSPCVAIAGRAGTVRQFACSVGVKASCFRLEGGGV